MNEIGHYMETVSRLRDELAEAQESYRLANARIVELLDEKMAAERQRDQLGVVLDATLSALEALQHTYKDKQFLSPASDAVAKALQFLADPAAILAAREKPLRDALDAIVRADEQIGDHLTARVTMRGFADHALAAAPKVKA